MTKLFICIYRNFCSKASIVALSILQGAEHPRCPRYCHSSYAKFMQCICCVQTETNYETRKISSNEWCVLLPHILLLCRVSFSCLTALFCLWDIDFAESNSNLRIESISHETFALSHRSLLFDNFGDDEAQSDSFSQSHSSHSASNVVSSSESSEQVASGSSGVNYAATEGSKNYDSLSSWGEDPWVASNSSEEVRYIVIRETSRCRCFASKTC